MVVKQMQNQQHRKSCAGFVSYCKFPKFVIIFDLVNSFDENIFFKYLSYSEFWEFPWMFSCLFTSFDHHFGTL